MKKIISCLLICSALSACSSWRYEEPDYNYIAAHVRVAEKHYNYVVYDYKNIRVDEVAPIAAIYCNETSGRQANLYNIELRPDGRRRATFVCKE